MRPVYSVTHVPGLYRISPFPYREGGQGVRSERTSSLSRIVNYHIPAHARFRAPRTRALRKGLRDTRGLPKERLDTPPPGAGLMDSYALNYTRALAQKLAGETT